MADILKAQAAGPQDRSSLFRSARPSSSTAPAEASGVPGLDTTPGATEQRARLESQFQARESIEMQSRYGCLLQPTVGQHFLGSVW